MSLLTDDDKALLVLEHLGPAALAGDTMSLYDCFQLALDVAEKEVMAKLASAELPPLPAYECGPHTGHAAVRTDESIRAYGRQAYARGAAAQLAEKPLGWCGLSIDGKHIAHFDGKPLFMAGSQGNEIHPTPLYTRKESNHG